MSLKGKADKHSNSAFQSLGSTNYQSNTNTSRHFESTMVTSTKGSPDRTLKKFRAKPDKGDKENQNQYFAGKKIINSKPPTPVDSYKLNRIVVKKKNLFDTVSKVAIDLSGCNSTIQSNTSPRTSLGISKKGPYFQQKSIQIKGATSV